MNYFKQITSTVSKESPVLYSIVLFNLFLAIMCIAGLIVDDRTLLGINVWVKPLKFAISTGIYILTVGYLVNYYPYSRRKKKIVNGTVAWTLFIEMLIVPIQAGRGVQSHYNVHNAIDGIMFGSMGILIAINVLIMVMFAFDTIRLKLKTSKVIQWAILLGWLVVLVGSWVGGQMISQMAHNVGVADGGAGLPLINWSTKGGDLRIAHFFGLHGIQIIPLFAFIVSQKWKTTNRNQIVIVTVFALAYAAWIGFIFYQAKQGMPLIAA